MFKDIWRFFKIKVLNWFLYFMINCDENDEKIFVVLIYLFFLYLVVYKVVIRGF